MATFNFKAPVDGTITGANTYCTGGCHSSCCWTACGCGSCTECASDFSPRDISAGAGTTLTAKGITGGSIKVTDPFICCGSCTSSVFANVVEVIFYAGEYGEDFVGKVIFGHVDDPKDPVGPINVDSVDVGKVPGCGGECTCACYGGPHSHIEERGGTAQVGCNASVTKGSTAIYRWTY